MKNLFIALLNSFRILLGILFFLGFMYIIGSTFGYLNVLYFILFAISAIFLILKNYGSRRKRGGVITYNSREFMIIPLLSIGISIGLYSTYILLIENRASALMIGIMITLLIILPGWALLHFLRNAKDSVRLTSNFIEIKDNNKLISIDFGEIKTYEFNTTKIIITFMNGNKHEFDLFELNLSGRDGLNIQKDMAKLMNKTIKT
jgi:hypothetical protein